MRCLIDSDVLVYELGFSGEYIDDDGEKQVREFEFVAELLDQKIREIEAECWADEPSILFLTNDEKLNKMWNRRRKAEGKEPVVFKPNFRIDVAKAKPYKGQRKQEKPFHRDNIRAYMLDNYDVRIANGMEADDLITVHHVEAAPLTTIICTRDKDLYMTEGMAYGWPCGKQPQFGPTRISELGEIALLNNKIKGTGRKFFYSQLVTGDAVDNIPGLPRGGPALAYKLLKECENEEQMFKAVASEYAKKIGDGWLNYFMEQAGLLWMVRLLDEGGEPVMYAPNQEWIDDITRGLKETT